MNSLFSRDRLFKLSSIILIFVTIPISTTASIPIHGPAVISAPGEYSLQNDFINYPYTDRWDGIMINASGVWLDGMGHTIDGGEMGISNPSTDVHGIYVFSPIGLSHMNITIKNVTVTGCWMGIDFWIVHDSRIHHVLVRNNSHAGIFLFGSSDNQIYENDATGNSAIGISLHLSSNRNGLANNTVRSNLWGIETNNVRDNFIVNTTATGNTIGIGLTSSSYNTVMENTITGIDGHGDGLFLEASAGNNILTRNMVRDNYEGIRIDPTQTGADLIYDNHFNNTVNAFFFSNATNIWNTTQKPGPNIIGGRNIGGNYWATPHGDGFSQTHRDTGGNGFATPGYVLAPGNTDYLPLVKSPLSSFLAPVALTAGLVAGILTKRRTGKHR